MSSVRVLVAHASHVPAARRAAFARRLDTEPTPGAVVVETCHRVEVYLTAERLEWLDRAETPPRTLLLSGSAAASHVVRLAVGVESALIGDDQVLHQLRGAVIRARSRAALAPALDRLLDAALRAGRRARSWLPPRRTNLLSVALDRTAPSDLAGRSILVVGAGVMGQLAVETLLGRGARVLVASRTPERAARLAVDGRAVAVPFEPGPEALAGMAGVVIALGGPWTIGQPSIAALAASPAWIIDLSAPPALPAGSWARTGRAVVGIDDLLEAPDRLSPQLLARLEALVDETVDDIERWSLAIDERSTARALAARAERARSIELDELWRRVPGLDDKARGEVEAMARHLSDRLLRDPFESLGDDRDGELARAARALFRL